MKDRVLPSFQHVFVYVASVKVDGTPFLTRHLFAKSTPFPAVDARLGRIWEGVIEPFKDFDSLVDRCRLQMGALESLRGYMTIFQLAQEKRLAKMVEEIAAARADQWEIQRAFIDPVLNEPALTGAGWTVLNSFAAGAIYRRHINDSHPRFDIGVVVRKVRLPNPSRMGSALT